MPVAAPARLAQLTAQTERLLDRGVARLAGCTPEQLHALVAPLEERLPDEDFVLVLPDLVPAHRMVECAVLASRPGFTTMEADDLAAFRPTDQVEVPAGAAYVLVDVDTGGDTRGVRPDDALPGILASGRTPLTLEEGLAVAVQHPEWLRERNCFEMLGSRAGDKRVTGVWVSDRRPRLGWCWGGNPHTWLGMASAARRIG